MGADKELALDTLSALSSAPAPDAVVGGESTADNALPLDAMSVNEDTNFASVEAETKHSVDACAVQISKPTIEPAETLLGDAPKTLLSASLDDSLVLDSAPASTPPKALLGEDAEGQENSKSCEGPHSPEG